MDNLTVNNNRLEVSQLVLEDSLLVLTSKEVNAFVYGVTLSTQHSRIYLWRSFILR